MKGMWDQADAAARRGTTSSTDDQATVPQHSATSRYPGTSDAGRPAGHRGWLDDLGLRMNREAGDGLPLRRVPEGQIAGGVATGLARRTGYPVGVIRAVFVGAALITSGYLVIGYNLAWLLIPARGSDTSIGAKALADRRGLGLAAGLASMLVVALIIASALNAPWVTSLAVPLVVVAAQLVLIVRNAPDDERESLRGLTDPAGLSGSTPRSRRILRIVLALVLVVLGLVALLSGQERLSLLLPLTGIILLVGGVLTALGPWWLRIAKGIVQERQARIRAEERADMASRVHDSVLQTLALIQRRADDPQQVVRLARAQERELRAWLFDGRPPGSMEGQAATVAGAVRLIQQEVEAQHGVSVEAVTVGDCDLDEDLTALLAAAREATVNAAKWSGAPVVSVFAEVEPDAVSIFVRDRGCGFDPGAVPGDRKGLAESVRARLARRGGTATIRSVPGQGTEVALRMPTAAADRLPRPS